MWNFAWVLALSAGIALAQSSATSVVGRVTDTTGAVIAGVTVIVTNLDTNLARQTKSNDVGDYTLPFLPPGRYRLAATQEGFRTYQRPELRVEIEQALRIDIALELGQTTESVTVSDTVPALNTENGSRGEVTTNREISQMPSNGI